MNVAGMHRKRGAALLMALMVMAVIASIASAAFWWQWRSWAVEHTQRAQTQSTWLLDGALDWARLILLEDSRANQVDHLAEPWAIELQPTRLSTFLSAAQESGDAIDEETVLAGRIEDLQGKLNWRNTVEIIGDRPRFSQPDVEAFERLYALLGLPQQELQQVLLNLQRAEDPYEAQRPLLPRTEEDLRWLGLSDASAAKLRAHATWIPRRTTLNVNTAGELALQAASGLAAAEVSRLLKARSERHFDRVEQFLSTAQLLGAQASRFGVSSQFFRITGLLRHWDIQTQIEAVVQREGQQVLLLQVRRLGQCCGG